MSDITHDALKRRKRDTPTSTGKRIVPQPRDLLWFEKLALHGALSADTLHAYSAHLCKNPRATRYRLADLYHEDNTPHGGTYLDRPKQQRDTENSDRKTRVYDLTPRSEKVLAEQGIPVLKHKGWWLHQFMTAFITSPIELGALKTPNIRFIPQWEVLNQSALRVVVPYEHNGRTQECALIPDAFFGIEYGDKRRYFVVEADRSTENIDADNLTTRKTVRRNLMQYRQLIGRKMYKDAYGIDAGLIVLYITTNTSRMRSMMDMLLEISGGRGNNFITFATLPELDTPFKPPPPKYDLFTQPYLRAGNEPFFIDKP